jgi:hypothetical protein
LQLFDLRRPVGGGGRVEFGEQFQRIAKFLGSQTEAVAFARRSLWIGGARPFTEEPGGQARQFPVGESFRLGLAKLPRRDSAFQRAAPLGNGFAGGPVLERSQQAFGGGFAARAQLRFERTGAGGRCKLQCHIRIADFAGQPHDQLEPAAHFANGPRREAGFASGEHLRKTADGDAQVMDGAGVG